MNPLIELNRLSVMIDRTALDTQEDSFHVAEGNLPVINTPFQIEIGDIQWVKREGQSLPVAFLFGLAGAVIDPNWKVRCKLDTVMECKWRHEIARWGATSPFELLKLYLEEDSQIFIDDQTIDLIPTINQVLVQKDKLAGLLTYARINTWIDKVSQKYFGSSVLTDLLANLYYQIKGNFDDDTGVFSISAAYDLKHFSQTEEAPPYLFVKFPTKDVEFFVDHFNWPDIEIKGYHLNIESLKVKEDKLLEINVKELVRDWVFTIGVELVLDNNKIFPEVQFIHSEGLGVLTKTLFKLFKGVLKRQIEAKPIAVADVFQHFRNHLEIKYPFLKIQAGDQLYMDALSFDQEKTEIMIHFEDKNLHELV